MEYEERESEFDIEDEDKSEPEQTGTHTHKRVHKWRDIATCQGLIIVCVSQVRMLRRMRRWM